jgi:DNA/RNA endonuclease YhcR with UshA esterase domain
VNVQKEEKVVVVLLITAALCLIIAYFGFSSAPAVYSDDSKLGDRVYVEGTVLTKKMTRTGGHLILTISDLNIKVFVPDNSGAKEVYDFVRIGDYVRITGKVSEYRNAREIVVERARDIVRV